MSSAIPRSLLLEERCKGCGCIFARVPSKDLDPALCGLCIALNESLRIDLERGLLGEPETKAA